MNEKYNRIAGALMTALFFVAPFSKSFFNLLTYLVIALGIIAYWFFVCIFLDIIN